MNLTRKEFLKSGIILSGGFLLPGFRIMNPFQEQTYKFTSLRKDIGIFTERGGTIGYYATADGLIVVDAQYPETAKNLVEGLKKITPRKIDILFNTHHHGDHTSGNIYLKDFATKIVAQENCKTLQEKNDKKDPEKPQAYPTTTFVNTWTENVGSEKVTAHHFGPAHTGGDSVIHFENANVAHVGDLVFNKTYPFIDATGGGSIKQWIEVLGKVVSYFSKDTLFIFGHASANDNLTGSLSDIKEMQKYFITLMDFVSSEIKKGKNKEEVMEVKAIPGYQSLFERWQGARKMSLERAFDQITMQ